ncbi:MAG: hypothetical protein ACI8P7_000989 [Candidatus Azotimanducaceae bacterium]|jgi:hypothetical protein
MRIVDSIPHPKFRISVYSLNEKFMVEVEAGPMKQGFKFDQDIGGVENVKAVFDAAFLDQIHDTFNTMFVNLQAAKER